MSTLRPPVNPPSIGRFRIQRALGRGAEGVVYLAVDPTLGREVAIKTLSLGDSPNPLLADLLVSTARTASALSHPNIVPVFEADIHEGRPFVVFEYVEGHTLAQVLAKDGPLPLARATALMAQVLAGVALMHERGLLHGDIKPDNVLIGRNETPRIADFGLLRQEQATDINPQSGTRRYMAPECLTGDASDCRRDVFALGLVFHEVLTGKPVVSRGTDPDTVLHILGGPIAPPSAMNARVPPEIDAIVLKALHADPGARYPTAGHMQRDLEQYRVATDTPRVEVREQSLHASVEFLLRRMAFKSDFPALSASFSTINQLAAQADTASMDALADTVIRDFSLTQKLLRLVNSAALGTHQVTKVSQAITLLGVGQLRALATAMALANQGQAARPAAVAGALTDAFVAALIARNIGRMVGLKAVEELFICGMFSSLGDLLARYYLADEHAEIHRRVATDGVDADAAARAVLGLTFDELGMAVGRHWQFPDVIVEALAPLPPGAVAVAATAEVRMWHCTGYARELCALSRLTDDAAREVALHAHVRRFALSIPASVTKVRELLARSVAAAGSYTSAAELDAASTPMLIGMGVLCAGPPAEAPQTDVADAAAGHDAAPTDVTTVHTTQSAMSAAIPDAMAAPVGWRARLAGVWRSLF